MTTRRNWTLRIRRIGLLAAIVAGCVGVFGGSAGATNGSVIVVSDTVVGSTMDNPAPLGAGEGLAPSVSWEAYGAILNGKHVLVKTAAQVAAMPPADIANYDAVVLGDRQCATNPNILAPLVGSAANPAQWASAITGNVIVIGTDPERNYFYGMAGSADFTKLLVLQGALRFATAGTGTGAYIDLSCYYQSAPSGTAVDVLQPFGSFTVHGAPCTHDGHVVADHPAFHDPVTQEVLWIDQLFTDWWDCSAHEVFDSVPASFSPIVVLAGTGAPYIVGRGIAGAGGPVDTDGDGVPDSLDLCPNTAAGAVVDASGCSAAQRDSDGDGVKDDLDLCPNTAAGAVVDASGCSAAQRDTDGDGVKDDLDLCPNTAAGAVVDAHGCSAAQRDSDGDGVKEDVDRCPNTATGAVVDANGCSAAQRDSDHDGIPDAVDNCPTTANADQADSDFDGIGDACDPAFNSTAGQVDGEGRVAGVSFEFSAEGGKKPQGEVKLATKPDFRGKVTGVAIKGDVATIVGKTSGGTPFTIKVKDNGKRNDTFSFVSGATSISGTLTSGNVKIDLGGPDDGHDK